MNREQVIATLRAHEPELKQAGIVRLSLFGSTVRGDRGAHSDIDLLAAFDETRRISLLDVIHIENQIADLLGEEVDLLVEGTLRSHMKETVAREAVRAF
jgi:predicted nucleotidyltransferase